MLSIPLWEGVRYCFDDSYIVDPDLVVRDPLCLTQLNRKVFVTHLTPSIVAHNRMSLGDRFQEKVAIDETVIDSQVWNIPDHYRSLSMGDIINHLMDRQDELIDPDDPSYERRLSRIHQEMVEYNRTDRLDVIKLMMYIVDELTKQGIVWGVGRGSSASSYVLYLIGVHDVDSVAYDLNFNDFMK